MDVVIDWMLSMATDMLIATYYGIATTIWWIIKLVNSLATYITTETLWADILDSLMTGVTNAMPDVLDGLVFSGTGVMYVALSLSGILLIVNRGGVKNKIAEPAQVIVWGVLISVLFVGGTLGYDLITAVEQMRLNAANLALSTIAPSGEIGDLVAIPMRATSAEALDPSFGLPAQFETDFFQAADPADITTEDALIYDSFLLGPLTVPFDIEDAGAQQARKEAAVNGLFISLLTIGPAAVEGMFAVIYAALAAAAFVLVIFFISVLPLGFFSFGKQIIEKIMMQYFTLWMLSLASAVIIGILLGSGSIFLPANPDIPTIISGYLPILLISSIAVTYLMKLAFNVMMGTAGMVTATLRDEIGASAYNTRMPAAGEVPLSSTANAGIEKAQKISMLGSAAISGGMSIAALGGLSYATGGSVRGAVAGGLMSQMRPEAARDAAMLARYTSDGRVATSFAATAMGRNFIPAAVGLIATRPTVPEEKSSSLSNEDLATKVSSSPSGLAEKGFKKAADETGMGDSRLMRELIEVMRESRSSAKESGSTRFEITDNLLTGHSDFKNLKEADRSKLINSGHELVDDHHAKSAAKDIFSSRTGTLGRLADDKQATEADIGRAIKFGFKAAAESELTGKDNTAQRLAELLDKDKKFSKLPSQTRADMAGEIQGITGIADNRKLTDEGRMADMVKNPETAPAGADHAAMSAIREIAAANKLDVSRIIGLAQDGADKAKQGGSAPEHILDQLADSPKFDHLDLNTKADLARNADLVLQSIDISQDGTNDVRVVEDTTQRDSLAAKVEVVNQPTIDQKADDGTRDVRVIEDTTQRDSQAAKVEIVGDQTNRNAVIESKDKDVQQRPEATENSPLFGETNTGIGSQVNTTRTDKDE